MKFVILLVLVTFVAVIKARPSGNEAEVTKRQNYDGELSKRQYNGDAELNKRHFVGGITSVGGVSNAECPQGMYRAVDGTCQKPIEFDFD